jgi:hypothetical protein
MNMKKASKGFERLSSRLFGEYSRYHLEKCCDRFGNIVYFVSDAQREDYVTGLPEVIRQSKTEEEAISGLI